MVSDLIRESFVGQLVYRASRRRAFQYIEEKPDFQVPDRYASGEKRTLPPNRRSEAGTLVEQPPAAGNDTEKGKRPKRSDSQTNSNDENARSPEEEEEHWRNTVDWYGPDDPENPMNVSCPLLSCQLQY
jgi:DHA1 family multidrug resistance protein-like MFS transporter